MPTDVLILTNSTDGIHTDIVIEKLEQRGADTFRLDVDKIGSGELIINLVHENGSGDCEIEYQSKKMRLADCKSIWYRRPNEFQMQIVDPIQKDYAEKELRSLLDGLWHITDQAFWLNPPLSLERARRKVVQLNMAWKYGFPFPRTLISNDPDKVKSFFAACGKKMIFKALQHEMLDYGDHCLTIATTLITEKHLENVELLRKLPGQFQEFIDKEYEVRVTIVGDSIFPVRIDSQEFSETVVDWRHPTLIPQLKHSIIDLPKPVTDFCKCMLRELGLVFGAFDFVVNKTGQWLFLEVNPNGQWYWIENFTGLGISDALVNVLLARDTERR